MESPFQFVQIMTTSRCPGACMYCPYPEGWHAANPGVMTDELFEDVLRKLAQVSDYSKGKICPYLQNEPLTDPKLFSRIRRLRETFPLTEIEVNTNCLLLTPDVGTQLAKAVAGGKHTIYLHISGTDEETSVRAQGLPFKPRMDNVNRFMRAVDEYKLNVIIEGYYKAEEGDLTLFNKHRFLRIMQGASHGCVKEIRVKRFHDRAGNIKRHGQLDFGIRRECDCDTPDAVCRRTREWIHVGWDGILILCCQDYRREVALPKIQDLPNLKEYLDSGEWKFIQDLSSGREQSAPDFICKRCRGNR